MMRSLQLKLAAVRWPLRLAGILILCALVLPFVFILIGALYATSQWSELGKIVQGSAILNTLLLILSVVLLAGISGTVTAFLVERYAFPLRGFFSRALMLPLAIPGYVMAVVYSGIFDYGGEWQSLSAMFTGGNWQDQSTIQFRSFFGLCIVLALSLTPYIFISARSAFAQQSASLEESGLSLGKSRRTVFRKILLPVALPGIMAGAWLAGMETLNDYGASAYYGIRTVSTEIFRCWNADLDHAIYFSFLVCIPVFIVLMLQHKWMSSQKKTSGKFRTQTLRQLRGFKAFSAIALCALPFLFGFFIPFIMLLKWTLQHTSFWNNQAFIAMTFNSFQLAAIAALMVTGIAVVLNHAYAMNGIYRSPSLTRSGYVMPAAILAIGVLGFSTGADRVFGLHYPGVLTGSVFILIFAYAVRFMSVALQPMQAVYRMSARPLIESALSLGQRPVKILARVSFPVLKPVMVYAFIMVFMDVLKELPLTLILRPFNFETLSTSVFQYAKVNESVAQAAPAALIIVILGLIPVWLLYRMTHNGKHS